MVRLKHRYLLVHILYPNAHDKVKTKLPQSVNDTPYTIQFHSPSSDRLDSRLLLQIIRNGVSELFGDYGAGMIAGSLQGMSTSDLDSPTITRANTSVSQIPLSSNKHSHRPRLTGPLSTRLGSTNIHYTST